MVLMVTKTCQRCGETTRMSSRSWNCWTCEEQIAEENKKRHMDGLKNLPIEERIAKIEEWIYDLEHNPPWKRNLLR